MVNKKSRALVREKKHRRMRNHLSGTAEILWLQLPHLTKM